MGATPQGLPNPPVWGPRPPEAAETAATARREDPHRLVRERREAQCAVTHWSVAQEPWPPPTAHRINGWAAVGWRCRLASPTSTGGKGNCTPFMCRQRNRRFVPVALLAQHAWTWTRQATSSPADALRQCTRAFVSAAEGCVPFQNRMTGRAHACLHPRSRHANGKSMKKGRMAYKSGAYLRILFVKVAGVRRNLGPPPS